MIEQRTGRVLTPLEFKMLNPCVQCGRVANIKYGEMCYGCTLDPIPNCDICEICLRFGKYTFYRYDNKEEYRDVNFNAIKELIHEFSFEKEYINPPFDDLCIDCIDWKDQMKKNCAKCNRKFKNDREHYKTKGNVCDRCFVKLNG